jgi:hypothetical protein
MAPRTIWSACFGSTPRLTARSTLSSNLHPWMPLRIATASRAGRRGRIHRLAAFFIRLLGAHDSPPPRRVPSNGPFPRRCSSPLDIVGVQVGQLQLRDLAHLRLRHLPHLVAIRLARALLHLRSLLEQHRRGRRLELEGEAAVGVDRDHRRDDEPLLVLRACVERLAELHDVDAVLAERRAHRRRGIRRSGRTLQLHDGNDLLRHGPLSGCDSSGSLRPSRLRVVEHHRRGAPEHLHHHPDLLLVRSITSSTKP